MATVGKTFAGGAPATVLAAPITAGAPTAGATFTVAATTGTNYPTANFVVKVNAGNPTEEKIFCSSRSGDVFTVGASGRGYDGTVAADHGITEAVVHELDAATMTAITDHVDNDTADDHGQYLTASRGQALIDASIAAIPPGSGPRGTVYRSADVVATQNFAASGSTQDVTGLTAIAVTGDGARRFEIKCHLDVFVPAASGVIAAYLQEGATVIAKLDRVSVVSGENWTLEGSYDFVPAVGSHTYKIAVLNSTGSTLPMASTSTSPSYARATDVGT